MAAEVKKSKASRKEGKSLRFFRASVVAKEIGVARAAGLRVWLFRSERGHGFSGTDEELEAKRLALLEGATKSYLKYNPTKTDDGLTEMALELAEGTEGVIEGRQWHLLESTTSRVFVTSDNPVVLTRPRYEALWRAIGIKPGSVLLPLSPKRCLLIDDARRGDALVRISREKADAIDNYVILYAHNAVFSNLISKTIAAAFDRTVPGKNTDLPLGKLD